MTFNYENNTENCVWKGDGEDTRKQKNKKWAKVSHERQRFIISKWIMNFKDESWRHEREEGGGVEEGSGGFHHQKTL